MSARKRAFACGMPEAGESVGEGMGHHA